MSSDRLASRRCAVFILATLLSSLAGGLRATGMPPDPGVDIDLVRSRRHVDLETRRVLFGIGHPMGLLRGWSDPAWNRALDIRWAIAKDATVDFVVLDPQDLQFLVKLIAYPGEEPQHITVLANGEVVAAIDPVPEFREFRFVVARHLLRRGHNVLTFRHAVLYPAALPEDSRRFGAGYASILLGPNCLPLRPHGEVARPRVSKPESKKHRADRLMVTGPAEILYRLTVPPAARLHGRIVLGADTTNPARFTASIQDGDASSEVAALVLKRPLFGAGSPQDLSADLSRWAGKRIGLRFAIYPKSCVSSVATVTVLDASIRTDALGARDSLE